MALKPARAEVSTKPETAAPAKQGAEGNAVTVVSISGGVLEGLTTPVTLCAATIGLAIAAVATFANPTSEGGRYAQNWALGIGLIFAISGWLWGNGEPGETKAKIGKMILGGILAFVIAPISAQGIEWRAPSSGWTVIRMAIAALLIAAPAVSFISDRKVKALALVALFAAWPLVELFILFAPGDISLNNGDVVGLMFLLCFAPFAWLGLAFGTFCEFHGIPIEEFLRGQGAQQTLPARSEWANTRPKYLDAVNLDRED